MEDSMRRWMFVAAVAGLAIVANTPASAQAGKDNDGGVTVRRPSLMRNLVPAAKLEQAAVEQYGQLRAQATSRNALLPADDAVAKRVQRISDELLPFT
jgi:hypothetical protein